MTLTEVSTVADRNASAVLPTRVAGGADPRSAIRFAGSLVSSPENLSRSRIFFHHAPAFGA